MTLRPVPDQADDIEVLECPELAFLLAAARDTAWQSHCNVVGLRYMQRRESFARLRGALSAYDARVREMAG